MAAKPRKRQPRKSGARSGPRRGRWTWKLPSSRLRLVAFVALAIFAGSALGYGLGLLNRPAPDEPAVAETPRTAPPARTAPAIPATGAGRHAALPSPGPDQLPSERRADPAPLPAPPPSLQPPPAPSATAPEEAAWIRYAVASAEPPDKPAIAIVIDDVGLNVAQTRRVMALPAPLTLAFLTYAERLPEQAAAARAAGHELLVHLPMEPLDPTVDPGPNPLLKNLSESEILDRLRWGLSRFDGYVGVNNHMGSLFTTDEGGMSVVLRDLRSRGLLFLDSWTSAQSVGPRLARELRLPHTVRDVFLDNSKVRSDIRASLSQLEARAQARGHAIGIGHPYDETIAELAAWIEGARERGFAFVPVTAIVRREANPPRRLGGSGPAPDPAG